MELDTRDKMNAYHNLAGWLRDLRAAIADLRGGNLNPMSGSYAAGVYDLLDELREVFDDGASDDAPDDGEFETDDELEDGDDEMDESDAGSGGGTRTDALRNGAGSSRVVGRPAAVAGNRSRPVQQARSGSGRRAASVAAARRVDGRATVRKNDGKGKVDQGKTAKPLRKKKG